MRSLKEFEREWFGTLSLDNNHPCSQIVWSRGKEDNVVTLTGEELLLLPETLYRAELVAGEKDVVYTFEFTTSLFVNFVHHMHSFEERIIYKQAQGDKAAGITQLINTVSSQLDPMRKALQDCRADLTMKAKAAGIIPGDSQAIPTPTRFQEYTDALKRTIALWDTIQKVAADALFVCISLLDLQQINGEESLVISVIRSGNDCTALLLTSPTPLDWRRVYMELSRSSGLDKPKVFPSLKPGARIKISDAYSSPDAAGYWIELLARERVDLSGYSLLVQDASSTGVLSTFNTYYTFPQGTVLADGKRLRVGSSDTSLQKTDVLHLNQEEEKLKGGELSPLPAGMARLQLIDTSKEVIHEQVIQPEKSYTRMAAFDLTTTDTQQGLLLPNASGTAALLLCKEGELQEGAYRLTCAFQGNIGCEAPVLYRAGKVASEYTTLRLFLTGSDLL